MRIMQKVKRQTLAPFGASAFMQGNILWIFTPLACLLDQFDHGYEVVIDMAIECVLLEVARVAFCNLCSASQSQTRCVVQY